VVTVLLVVNIAIYILQAMTMPNIRFASPVDSPIARFGFMHTGLVLQGQVWRLITSQYLHGGGNHILFNMVGLYFLGRAMEQVWTPKKFLLIYTLAGICGNLFYMLLGLIGWLPMNAPMVGASGCILGLLGACAVLVPLAEVYVYFLFPIRIRTAAMLFAAWYVFNLWTRGGNAGGDAAHLAGLAFGAWYAKMGDQWWRLKGSNLFGGVGGGPASSRPARREDLQYNVQQKRADAELIDRLLAKVYEGGLHSLTPGERASLREATARQKQAEKHL
jgi:membrane associated rhomboid family serine protease